MVNMTQSLKLGDNLRDGRTGCISQKYKLSLKTHRGRLLISLAAKEVPLLKQEMNIT
jgi:hypothetical protein